MMKKFSVTLAAVAAATLLAACSGGGDAAAPAIEETTNTETVEESVEEVEAVDTESSESETPSDVALVDVVVVSYQPGNTIISIGSQATGADSCAIAVNAVLGSGNSVELQVDGEDSPRTAKLAPSSTNGESLPCRVEATFEDVPSDAASYTATQVGGSASGLYNKTVTGAELASAGNQIDLVEEESGYSLDAIIDATCLNGENSFLKRFKNYSQYSGPGRGNDIWVSSRVKFTNNCDKDVKAVTYREVFTDVFGDTILSCESKLTIGIKVGASKQTPKDRGCLVNNFNDTFGAWDTADMKDVSSNVVVNQIVFSDGSKIDSGL